MPKIGTGYVEIQPDLDKFRASLEKQLAGFDSHFRKVGQDAGLSFGDGFSRGSRDVDRSTASLAKAERQARRTAKGFEGLVAAAGGGDGNLRKMARSLDNFGGASTGATATLGGFRIALAALVPLTLGFGGATVSAASALGPLVGLVAAAGNVAAAAAQGFGAFKLATMGVADALKEQIDKQGKAATSAASSAGAQRAAARGIQSAQDGVRSAVQGLSDAQDEQRKAVDALGPAYTAARVRLNDLREAATDAGLSLQGARLAATDARVALASLLAGPDPRKLADAHRAVDNAVRGEQDAVQGLSDAYKALNDLLKPPDVLDVADATDAVADAVRNEERARLALNAQIAKTNDVLLAEPGLATDDQRAQAALDLADAQNAVGDATRATTHAQQSLAKLQSGPSQDEVAAARRRVSDAERQVKDAADATKNARVDLAEAEKPASSQEIAKARLDVAQAENAVRDAERDQLRSARELRDAEQKGIGRSDEVVAARDAIAKADRRVEDAELAARRASQALSDAQLSAKESMTQTSAAAANLDQKFNKLPPAAQAFVKELVAMKPRLDELRRTAASGFFPGATEGLRSAAQNFDSVNKVVGQTSRVLGEAARKSGELVGSPAFGRDIEIIGGRNAKVIDTLGEALRHVVSALRYVALAAGPLTQHLADLILAWSKTAASAAKAGEENGKMAAFFARTEAITKRLVSIITHLASGLIGLGGVGRKTGDDIWRSIDRAAARFDEWANSVAGQKSLQRFFQQTRDLAAALTPVLSGITSGVSLLMLRIFPLSSVLKLLGPYANEATVAFIGWKAATLAVAAAERVATVATQLYALWLRRMSLAAIQWRIELALAAAATYASRAAMLAAVVVTQAWAAAQWLLNAALTANPIGLVIVGLAALVGGFVLAYKNSETFRNIVSAALHAVGDAFTWLWNAAKDVFGWLRDNWLLVLGILTGPIGLAVVEIVKHWDDIKGAFSDGMNAVIGVVKGFASALISVGSWIVNRIVDGIKAVAGFAADVGGWVKDRVSEGIHAVVDAFKSVGGWILNRIIDGFKVVTDLLGSVGGWVRNRIEEFIHNEISGLKNIGSWILNRLVDGFTTVTDALGSVGGWLKNRISDFIDGAKDGFVSVGKSIVNFIVDGMKSGGKLLLGFVNDIIGVINTLLGAIGVDKIEPIKAKSVGLAEGGVHGLAHGGAFARTGGIVDRPIVLMGEEAPAMPEFVIPTNPAYRDRARELLWQAWRTIGFAGGGLYSKADLVALWKKVNPGLGDPNLMAAIALAESGGDPNAGRSHPYHGLWQVGPDGPWDPVENARAAGGKLRTQGLTAWEAYTNGTYRQFLGAGGGGGGILGAITGAIGDLLSKGADLILDKLPGVGKLPTWLKGVGGFLIDKIGGWIKDKVSDAIGLGGGDGAPSGGVTDALKGAMAFARSMGLQITSTTGGNHVANSWHYKGRAFDAAGSAGEMAAFYRAALARYDGKLIELFYDPVGAIKNGRSIPPVGGHSDHVHLAMEQGGVIPSFATGGIVPGPLGAPRLIEAHGGEAVLSSDTMADLATQLRILNSSPTADVIAALVGIVNTSQGRSARHRSMTAGRGGFPATP